MLVLTRRKNEEILFPNLGISVRIVDVRGKTVRLGVEAPRDVRIVRNEIEYFEKDPGTKSALFPNDPALKYQLRKQMDAANLALHLARNQMRQGLTNLAVDALDQALGCLKMADESLAGTPDGNPVVNPSVESPGELAVHESRTVYQTQKKKAESGAVLVFAGLPEQRAELERSLKPSEKSTIHSVDEENLVPWLLNNPQPDFAYMICEPAFLAEPLLEPPLALGNLQQENELVQVAGLHTVRWSPGNNRQPVTN